MLLLFSLLVAAASASRLSLDGEQWTLTNGTVIVPAQVPGTAPDAFYAAGVRPNPEFGENQLDVLAASTTETVTYRREFDTPAEGCSASGRRCELVFEGAEEFYRLPLHL